MLAAAIAAPKISFDTFAVISFSAINILLASTLGTRIVSNTIGQSEL